jgi:hypothetical protein
LPSPKWIGHFNKLKIRNRFVLSALKAFQECLAPSSYRRPSVSTAASAEFSDFLEFEKGLQMVHRMDHKIGPRTPE